MTITARWRINSVVGLLWLVSCISRSVEVGGEYAKRPNREIAMMMAMSSSPNAAANSRGSGLG
jgi:hypothetical protein